MISEKYSAPKGWWRVVVFLGVFFAATSAQVWGPDVRLTYDPEGSYLSHSNARCVAASGDTVHVVWEDQRDGVSEIYYKRSIDNGETWGEDIRLTNDPAYSYEPSIAVYGENVHEVWCDSRNGHPEIFYKRSTDGGSSWGVDTRLVIYDYGDVVIHSSVDALGDYVHVVWSIQGIPNNSGLRYKRSTDNGETWESTEEYSVGGTYPSIAACEKYVHIWDGIRYWRSTNNGMSWDAVREINESGEHPSIACSGNTVHLVWDNGEVYYKRSSNRGTSWGEEQMLSVDDDTTSGDPSIAASGDNVHVVWCDDRHGLPNSEIYYRHSTDDGIIWREETRLTNNSAPSFHPFVAASENNIHVVWYDFRGSPDAEIYYKHGTLEGAIEENLPPTSKGHFLEVFCGIEPLIQYGIPKWGKVDIVIFDVTGRVVQTLLSGPQSAGNHEIPWDECDDRGMRLSAGIYFCQLRVGEHSITRKLVLLR